MDNESRAARFGALFEAALQAYEKKTDITLPDHPLAVQLHNCRSIESITAVLLGEAQAFEEFRGSDRVMKSVKNIVLILSRIFATAYLNDAIDLVRQKLLATFSTALTFFTAISTCKSNIRQPCYPTFCMFLFFRSYEDILVTSK